MFNVLNFQRMAHALHRAGFRRAAYAVTALARSLFSAHIPPEVVIGAGTEFGYGGIGVIVHKDSIIGRNVLISPGVVIGGRSGLEGVPVIEDGAKIGAGAKVLGPIRIGAGAKVGANAVVLHDVRPGDTVAGVPARPLHRSRRSAA